MARTEPKKTEEDDELLDVDDESDSAPSSPKTMSVQRTLRLMLGVCDALAFLHGEGLVHRDLKPANILVRPDGTPVVADFGLVAQFGGTGGRDVLEFADPRAGTLAYMAPEQRTGRFVDARADLFSLGCILYEAVTGALPFGLSGAHSVSMTPPAKPSELCAGLPPNLDDLILTLLERDPRERPGYASDIGRALARALGQDPHESNAHQPYLYRPEFAGRSQPLARLESLLQGTLYGQGAKAFVSGESGVGKTRLALELAGRAADLGLTVITGDCVPSGAGALDERALSAPLRPLRELLLTVADACRAGGDPDLLISPEDRYVLGRHEPRLLDLSKDPPPDPDVLPNDAARARLFASLRNVLSEFARRRPVLVVLDDLQWADDLTLDFLRSLTADACQRIPVALVGTFRSEETSPALHSLVREPGVHHEHLPLLDRTAVHHMVSGMLALRSLPMGLVGFLADQSRGNAFFVAEWLRAVIADGFLRRDASGRWTLTDETSSLRRRVTTPRSIVPVVERRLQGLDDVARRCLFAAAVLGRDFEPDLVARMAGLDADTVFGAYAVLTQRQILDEDEAGRSRFLHDTLRETAYGQIDEAGRVDLHARAAAALEERYGTRDDSYLATIGYHHGRAGSADRAAAYFEGAADAAREKYANGDALRFYRRALEEAARAQANDVAARGRLLERIGELLLLTGEVDSAFESFAEALHATPAEHLVERARRRRKMAQTRERHHKHAEALALYRAAEDDLGAPSFEHPDTWWHEWVQIQVDKAWDLYWLADVAELAALIGRAEASVERYGLPPQRALFFRAKVHWTLRRDRYVIAEDTIGYGRASLKAAEESPDLAARASARFCLAFPLLLAGREEEAEPLFLTTIAESQRLGHRMFEARSLSYYSLLHRRLGRVERTREAAERALRIAEEGAMHDYVGVSHANLTWVAWSDGRADGMAMHGEAARRAWDKLLPQYSYPLRWMLLMPLAAKAWQSGDVAAAARHLRAMLDPTQHRLPDPLVAGIESLGAALAPDDPRFDRVFALAHDSGYL